MDVDIKELYGHLPFPELFSQHQSEWLNDEDWLNIVNLIKKDFIEYLIERYKEGYEIDGNFLERELKYLETIKKIGESIN